MSKQISNIIKEYIELQESTKKKMDSIKKDIYNMENDELEKAKNKIYSYFEDIQKELPETFNLSIKLGFRLGNLNDKTEIILSKNYIVLYKSIVSTKYYHLSRNNVSNEFGNFNSKINNLDEKYTIRYLVKNWDVLKKEVETSIKLYFEKNINTEISSISNTISNIELLKGFSI